MRILCPIVQPFVGTVLDTGHDLPLRRDVGSKLVGDHHPRRSPLALQKLAHQAFGRFGIAAALHQHLQNKSVLVNGAPQPVLLASNRNDDLIKVPLVSKLAG